MAAKSWMSITLCFVRDHGRNAGVEIEPRSSLFAIRAFRSTDRSPAGFRAADRQLFDAWRPEQARLTRRHLFLRRVLGSAAGTLCVAE
jgi:hypothetical protein